MNEFGHTYEGTDANGNDVYSLVDEAGNTVVWSVASGDDSRAVIADTLAYRNPEPAAQPEEPTEPPPLPEVPQNVPQPIPLGPTVNPPPVDNSDNQDNTDDTNDTPYIPYYAPVINDTPIFSSPSLEITPPANPAINSMNSNGHKYEGKDSNGNDVYSLIDEAGNVVSWSVKAGDDSRAVIDGTIGYRAAQTVAPTPDPVATTSGDPSHHYIGKDSNGNDVYQLVDEAGNLVQWSVKPGDDSRNAIDGTVNYPTTKTQQPNTVNPPTQTQTGPANTAPAEPTHVFIGHDINGNDVYQLIDEAGNTVQWVAKHGDDSNNAIAGTIHYVQPGVADTKKTATATTNVSGENKNTSTGNAATPSHTLVGRDKNGNDVYQLRDEAGNLVEWAVKHNDDSRASISSTVKYITPGTPTQVDPSYKDPIAAAAAIANSGGSPTDILGDNAGNITKIATAILISILTR